VDSIVLLLAPGSTVSQTFSFDNLDSYKLKTSENRNAEPRLASGTAIFNSEINFVSAEPEAIDAVLFLLTLTFVHDIAFASPYATP